MEQTFQSALKDSFKDIGKGVSGIIKGEIHLAISEAKHTVGKVATQSKLLIFAAVAALIASIFLLAFVFSGLAELLGGRYWLSALILTVAFGGAAAFIALGAIKKLKAMDMKLPVTRASLQEQRDSLPGPVLNFVEKVQNKLHKEPTIKKQPETQMYEAKLEVADAHQRLRSGTHGLSEAGKDIVEVGRNFKRLTPQVKDHLIKAGPVATAIVPGLTLGYLVSKKMRKNKTDLVAGPGQVVYRTPDQLH